MRHGRLITAALTAMAVISIAPAWAAAAPGSFVDDTAADFGAGTQTGTGVVAPGSVRLNAPIAPETFDGNSLPPGLTATQWTTGMGAATVAGGLLDVDGVRVHGTPLYDAGQVVEFRAAFLGTADEHIGFGDTLADAPFAVFSMGHDGLGNVGVRARTLAAPGDTESVTPIAISDATALHTYRIEWAASDVKYFVDDVLVATHAVAITAQMRPVMSDLDAGNGGVSVDSLGQMVFPTSGTIQSRELDARDPNAAWTGLTAVVDKPSATDVTIETRTSNDATSWSLYQPLGIGGAIQSPSGRYLQYRATLSTTANGPTPRLDRVDVTYDDSTGPTTAVDPVQVSGTTATVAFSSAAADLASFQCSLDGAAFATCASPAALTGLAAGAHTMSVRGIDELGNPGPAVDRTFTIDGPPASGGGGGSTGTTTQTSGGNSGAVADKTKPKVSAVAKSLRVSKTGTVSFRVGCPATEKSCKVTLQLQSAGKTVARKTATINGGKTATVMLKLTKTAKQQLAKRGSLRVSSVVSATDAAGNHRTTTKQLTLRRPA